MESKKKTPEQSVKKFRKGLKVIGILMLVHVVFRFLYYLVGKFLTANTFMPCCPLPRNLFLSSLFILIIPYYIITGITLIRGKTLIQKRYLISTIILDSLMILCSLYLYFFVGNVEPTERGMLIVYTLIGLEIVLPIVGYVIFKQAMKYPEYKSSLFEESKATKIFFIILLLLSLVGFVYAGYGNLKDISRYHKCLETGEGSNC